MLEIDSCLDYFKMTPAPTEYFAELDTFLTVDLDQPVTEYLALFIKLEPREVVQVEEDVPVNRFRKLWQA